MVIVAKTKSSNKYAYKTFYGFLLNSRYLLLNTNMKGHWPECIRDNGKFLKERERERPTARTRKRKRKRKLKFCHDEPVHACMHAFGFKGNFRIFSITLWFMQCVQHKIWINLYSKINAEIELVRLNLDYLFDENGTKKYIFVTLFLICSLV